MNVKNMLCLVLVICITSIVPQAIVAQEDFDDFFDSADDEFKKLKREADENFAELRKSVDVEFGDILNRAWKELELATGIQADTTPKPEEIPVARPPEVPEEIPEEVPVEVPEAEPQIEKKQIEIPTTPGTPLSLDFYATPIQCSYDSQLKIDFGGTVSERTISTFWETVSSHDYETLLGSAIRVRKQLGLNDWGYCLLLNTIAAGIYGETSNEHLLFTWFLLIKSGYDARVGFIDNRVFLLLPSLTTIYNTPFYNLDNKNYYVTHLGTSPQKIKSLYTYEGSYKDATRNIDFNIYTAPDITKTLSAKTYRFMYGEKEHEITVKLNKHVIDFYEFYPQTHFDIYPRGALTAETSKSLLNGLRPLVADQPETESVNMLLRFVQVGFEYKTDDAQFAREKFMFPEETLYYPFCDCEDRSALFAYLVRNLLGLEVIGLDYPGHIATAVKFNAPVTGDSVDYNNATFIICDPTYINANLGECMPTYQNVTPKVIPIVVE